MCDSIKYPYPHGRDFFIKGSPPTPLEISIKLDTFLKICCTCCLTTKQSNGALMVTSIVFLFQDAEHGHDCTDLVAGFWTIGSQAEVNNITIGLNCFLAAAAQVFLLCCSVHHVPFLPELGNF